MCFSTPSLPKSAPMLIPATTNAEAQREADLEAALRRRRAGAAADILTGPTGIPAGGPARRPVTPQLGGVAA